MGEIGRSLIKNRKDGDDCGEKLLPYRFTRVGEVARAKKVEDLEAKLELDEANAEEEDNEEVDSDG